MVSIIIITPEYYIDIGDDSHRQLMRTQSFKLEQYLAEEMRLVMSCGHTSSIKPRTKQVLLRRGHTIYIKPRTYDFKKIIMMIIFHF